MLTMWRKRLSLSIILPLNYIHLDFLYLPLKHLVLDTIDELILKKLNHWDNLVWPFLDC